MIKSLENWLKLRPTADETDIALEQAKSLIIMSSIHGLHPDTEVLKELIQWVWLSQQLPIGWLEMKVQEELYGTK